MIYSYLSTIFLKPLKHLFDLGELNVYDKKNINLSAGTPGLELLGGLSELFAEATKHRLVRSDHK